MTSSSDAMVAGASDGNRRRADRPCPMCGENELYLHFAYDSPPDGETRFPGLSDKDYWREMHRCRLCGHFLEKFEVDQSKLYGGDYIDATYGDEAGIKRSFDRINALPPEESDNIGRVRFVQEFCRARWNPARFADRKPRLLDVGAGLGVFPFRMKEAGWECTAIDMDERLSVHHREIVGVDSAVADVRSYEGRGKYDLITFNKVLEHVAEPEQVLLDCIRLLTSEGCVYIELPDGEAADAEGKEREEFLVGHIHVFSFASFALLAAKANLTLLHVERIREPSSKYTLRGFARPHASTPK